MGPHPGRTAGADEADPGRLTEGPPADLDALIAPRAAALADYQSKRYAARYQALIREVVARETAVTGAPGPLSRAAAEGLYRVMAYKDEYEVARLHAAATYGEKPCSTCRHR